MKHHIFRYTVVVIGCLITACAINLFYIPNTLLSGGITGLFGLLPQRPAHRYYEHRPQHSAVLFSVEVYGQGILFRLARHYDVPFPRHRQPALFNGLHAGCA